MKHLINIIVTIVLVLFAVGIVYVEITYGIHAGGSYGFLMIPNCIFMLLWGIRLHQSYD